MILKTKHGKDNPTMKTIHQLCNSKGISIKQLFKELNTPFKIITPSEWDESIKANEFKEYVADKVCEFFDIDPCDVDFKTIVKYAGQQKLAEREVHFKKAKFGKVKNLPKSSDKLCTGNFGRCKSNNGVQRAHYTGEFQSLFGKGLSGKVHDLYTAYLCLSCHNRLDQPRNRKSSEASHEFSIAINLSRKFDFDNGLLIYKAYQNYVNGIHKGQDIIDHFNHGEIWIDRIQILIKTCSVQEQIKERHVILGTVIRITGIMERSNVECMIIKSRETELTVATINSKPPYKNMFIKWVNFRQENGKVRIECELQQIIIVDDP